MRTARILGVLFLSALSPLAYAQQDGPLWSYPGSTYLQWHTYNTRYITTNVPLSIAASTTATNIIVLDVRDVDSVGIFLSGLLTATNPAVQALAANYTGSIDGTNFTTASLGGATVTLNGTNRASTFTNILVNNLGWLKFTFANGTTNISTNLLFEAVSKPTSLRNRSR